MVESAGADILRASEAMQRDGERRVEVEVKVKVAVLAPSEVGVRRGRGVGGSIHSRP